MSYNQSGGSYRPAGGSGNRPLGRFNSRGGGAWNSYNKYNSQAPKKPYERNRFPRANYSNVYNQASNANNTQQLNNQFQLWMGDLDPSWDENSIINIWAAFGEKPTSVKIIKDKGFDQKSAKSSYCFVSFTSQKAVSAAILKNGLQIPGSTKVFKLNWASGSSSMSNLSSGVQGNNPQNRLPSKNIFSIFVGDLGPDVSEALLFEKLNQKYPNQIKQVKIMFDPISKLSKGFGFVRFLTQTVQQKALTELNGMILNNRPIRVGVAAGSSTSTTSSETTGKGEASNVSNANIVQHQPPLNKFTDPDNTILKISELSSQFTEKELENIFIAYGDILHCSISSDFNTGYVQFYLRKSAELALLVLYGTIINNHTLNISWGSLQELNQSLSKSTSSEDVDSAYKKIKPAPLLFGLINKFHTRLDYLKEDQKDEVANRLINSNGPQLLADLNDQYLKSKFHMEEIIDNSLI